MFDDCLFVIQRFLLEGMCVYVLSLSIVRFFTPPRVSKEVGPPVDGIEGRSNACPHKGTCKQYILKVNLLCAWFSVLLAAFNIQ